MFISNEELSRLLGPGKLDAAHALGGAKHELPEVIGELTLAAYGERSGALGHLASAKSRVAKVLAEIEAAIEAAGC